MEAHVARARRLLGVAPGANPDELRAAYRRLLKVHHPDLSADRGAARRTAELTAAYRLLVSEDPPTTEPAPAPAREDPRPTVPVALVDADTIGVGAPAEETFLLLLDAAQRLGEVSYLDPSAGLLEVIVEFVEAPTSSVVLTLQGRASGVTEVFCGVEPLSGGEAPPVAGVTRLVLDALAQPAPRDG